LTEDIRVQQYPEHYSFPNFPDNVPFARHPAQLLDVGTARIVYETGALIGEGVLAAAAFAVVGRLRRALSNDLDRRTAGAILRRS
jgi:hypothetical protein